MQYIVYGIPNCDTVRKARKWLDEQCIEYRFHDIRDDGLTIEQVTAWCDQLGADIVLNKRSTSWRQLTTKQQHVTSSAQAAALIVEHPTLMKRPLLESEQAITVGFSSAEWSALLA